MSTLTGVTCLSGCYCHPTVIDAAVPPREERVSILKTKSVPIGAVLKATAGSGSGEGALPVACRMRLEVEQETMGGGHKFKVSQVTVRSAMSTV